MAHQLPIPGPLKASKDTMLSRVTLDHDNVSGIFLDEPPLQANRMVDLSISEGHITIDPMDTRYFCAAVSYYNDIYKITTEVRSDGPGLENQRAEVSTKIEALETLYHGPNSASDLRIGLLWFKVLHLLENHVEAYNVIRLVNRKTQKFSPWLFKLISRSRDLRKRQDESIVKLVEKARDNDPPKSFPREYSLERMRDFVIPNTVVEDFDLITYNLFMARIIVSYVLRRFQMLPLLIRTEDILYYRHVRSYAFNDGNLYHLANFFGTLQIQALMITMAQDEDEKKPSVRHSTFVLNFVKGLTELLTRTVTRSALTVQPYNQTGWHTAIPFETCPKNSYCINFHKNKETAEKAIYARILIGPFRPWRRGNVAVYLQNSLGCTLWLTCVNLVEPEKLDMEIERVGGCCGMLLNGMEEQNLVTVVKKTSDPSNKDATS
ncbi:uncharacterized protein H6S33_012091 [Morchella sextelata]|uniref:uncharacterized protein n=1 Tax=Morchella sextelata TaxID=1174677 RepID=UPI001D045BFF|nr:uncharacterized protein H6S33_012091 [Morchella sextelata]KAH0610564.1 hypothetical protein H6S33_012091 [Morchella sextelata]